MADEDAEMSDVAANAPNREVTVGNVTFANDRRIAVFAGFANVGI